MSKRKKKEFLFNMTFAAIVFGVYLCNKAAKVFYWMPLEFGRNHMNDVLCGLLWPCTLNSILFFSKYEFRVVNPVLILVFSLVASLFWEYVAPFALNRGTSDLLDVACYLLGSLGYLLIHSKASVIFDFRV